jgi:protein SCO1/2
LSRYLFGIEYGPRDLRLAIVDASAGKVGTAIDSFLLYCYHYDPMTGRYGLAIMQAIRAGGAATVLALAAFVAVMLRRERRAAHPLTRSAWHGRVEPVEGRTSGDGRASSGHR